MGSTRCPISFTKKVPDQGDRHFPQWRHERRELSGRGALLLSSQSGRMAILLEKRLWRRYSPELHIIMGKQAVRSDFLWNRQ